MIRHLWDLQVEAIIDVKISDADMDSYKYEPMAALLARWEIIKKYNHGNNCHNQRKHFSSFVISMDGILVREALVVIFQFS